MTRSQITSNKNDQPAAASKQIKVKIEKGTSLPAGATYKSTATVTANTTTMKLVAMKLVAPAEIKKETPGDITQLTEMDSCNNCISGKAICVFWEKQEKYREIAAKVENSKVFKGPTQMNSAIRFSVYRQYVKSYHPGLQRGQRIRIPNCVIMNIRKMWPNEVGEDYVGHKSGFYYTFE